MSNPSSPQSSASTASTASTAPTMSAEQRIAEIMEHLKHLTDRQQLIRIHNANVQRMDELEQAKSRQFRLNQAVKVQDKYGRQRRGVIVSFNRRTVSVLVENKYRWRVPARMLRPVHGVQDIPVSRPPKRSVEDADLVDQLPVASSVIDLSSESLWDSNKRQRV